MSGGSSEQIKAVLDWGTLPQLCQLLTVKDSKTALLVLETIGAVLAVSLSYNLSTYSDKEYFSLLTKLTSWKKRLWW